MFPSVPSPNHSQVKLPIDAKLKVGWAFDAKLSLFISDQGERFDPFPSLPTTTQIVYKVPNLVGTDDENLSDAERDLKLYIQVILPESSVAQEHVDKVREWPCLSVASVGPTISLPKM